MRVVLAAAGSRGDVVPFGALASRLIAAGHEATVVTHTALLGALPVGLPAVGVPSDPADLLAGPAGRALRRGSPRALNRARADFAAFLSAFAAPTAAALRTADADVLVASTFAVAAVDAGLAAGVPVVRAHQWPEYPGVGGPMPLLPYSWRLPAPARRGARRGLRAVEPFLGGLDGWWERGRLRLVAHHPVGLTTATHGTLHAYSPRVMPPLTQDRPSGRRGGGTVDRDVCVTGWWVAENDPPLSPATAELLGEGGLGAGTRWVYVGFGSMQQADPDRLLTDVTRACRSLGVRAVVQLARRPRAAPPGGMVCIGPEPHAALFPRMAVVVHHGGSGTTGAAVRAGVPSVVVPHVADQFTWAHRLHELGVAARPLPRARLTADRLADRIAWALRADPARRARGLAEAVRAEDGTGAAVAYLERSQSDRAGP